MSIEDARVTLLYAPRYWNMRRYSSPQELKLLLDGNINIRVYRELRKEDLRYRASCWNVRVLMA